MRILLILLTVLVINAQQGKWANTNLTASNITFWRVMSKDQLFIRLNVDIQETKNYKCVENAYFYQHMCNIYCRVYYDYVPALPQKNLRKYNPDTGYCEPGPPRCPPRLGVYYDQQSRSCIDQINGLIVSPLQPVAPVYGQNELVNVTYICMYGNKVIRNGFQQCQCWIGFKSIVVEVHETSVNYKNSTILLCNKQALLQEYLPLSLGIYIDELQINVWPYAADDAYWLKLLIYGIKQLKFAIGGFFRPWTVAIAIFIIPQQPLFEASDIPYLIWILITITVIFLLTLYQKKVHGKTIQQLE